MTQNQIKIRALCLAAQQLGERRVTRISQSMLEYATKAAAEAVDLAILLALQQHKRSAKTLSAPIGSPIMPARHRWL